MARKNRSGAPNKRKGSSCKRKMMSAKNAAKRSALRLGSLDRLARKMKQRVESKAKLKERRV